jgi:hypothetical protein
MLISLLQVFPQQAVTVHSVVVFTLETFCLHKCLEKATAPLPALSIMDDLAT